MASNRKVMVLPGDGIGNDVMQANMKIIDWLAKHRSLGFDLSEGLVGGAAYDVHGTPLTDETLADSIASDAVLLARLAHQNMMAFRLRFVRKLGFCGFGRKWIFSPTCGQRWFSQLWLMPQR